jgi:hypothetical protein
LVVEFRNKKKQKKRREEKKGRSSQKYLNEKTEGLDIRVAKKEQPRRKEGKKEKRRKEEKALSPER